MSERRMERLDATEVYVSEAGMICIKQERDLGDEDPLVILSPDQTKQVITWLQECLEEAAGG